MKLMRCEDCPSDLDEQLFERLRDWRTERAREQGLPAYCVFTDKTLLAIAENVPGDETELSRISGVGAQKLRKFGADVLALCAGEEPGEEPDEEPGAEPGEKRGAERGEGPGASPREEPGEEPEPGPGPETPEGEVPEGFPESAEK
jgi:DNA helicase-2/ATP-dependent DNA helicase PcrA